MTLRLRLGVALRSLLILCALLKVSQSQCNECGSNATVTVMTTRITADTTPGCNVSIEQRTSENGTISNLIPGEIYQVFFQCVNCCVAITMKPEKVNNLTINEKTTASMSLTWERPTGRSSMFSVTWSNGKSNKNASTNATNHTITGLTPGTKYDVSVSAVAADNSTEGEVATISGFTRPAKPGNITVSSPETVNLRIYWTLPGGGFQYFEVSIVNEKLNYTNTINTTEKTIHFNDLAPGRMFVITVTAVAGESSSSSSEPTSFATRPVPPKHIEIQAGTNSLRLSWDIPQLQDAPDISYNITYQSDGGQPEHISSVENKVELRNLTSGTRYNITLVTIGPLNLISRPISQFAVTKPHPVLNLQARPKNTTTVEVTWSYPYEAMSNYKYWVQVAGGQFKDQVNGNSIEISNLEPGTRYDISVIVMAAAESNSTEERTHTYTEPDVVEELTVTNVTTTSMSLSWLKPKIGNVESYLVRWNHNEQLFDNTSVTITHLSPGTQYNVSVAATVQNGTIKGQSASTTNFTRPAKPRNVTVPSPQTDNLQIYWTLPGGGFQYFEVSIVNEKLNYTNTTNTTGKTIHFNDLAPGRMFVITVTAVAGESSSSSSEPTSFATRPVPPDHIEIQAGTDSLRLSWDIPQLQDAPDISYNITYQSDGGQPEHISSVENKVDLRNLTSGTRYNITLVTIGPLNLISRPISQFAVTKPHPVLNLQARPKNTTTVEVTWSYPYEAMSNYKYWVQVAGGQFKDQIDGNSIEISNLEPGTRYDISVIVMAAESNSTEKRTHTYTEPDVVKELTVTNVTTTSMSLSWLKPKIGNVESYLVRWNHNEQLFDNTSVTITHLSPGTQYNVSVAATVQNGTIKGQSASTTNFTKPRPVTELKAENVTMTTIRLTWLRQDDFKPSYLYLVEVRLEDKVVYNSSTSEETHTIAGLTPGALYMLDVSTVVGGVNSNVESISCQTYPAAVSNISVIGGTTNLSVSWTRASGIVSSYSVSLYRGLTQVDKAGNLSKDTLTTLHLNLTPGVVYCVVVVTHADSLTTSSSVCNATFPTLPGPIGVESQSVEAINFTWSAPQLMDHQQYNFTVSSGHRHILTDKTWFLLDALESGSKYNISVVTVGVRNYLSTEVTAENYTRPRPATNLTEVKVTTTTVTLRWDQQESKPHYSYVVHHSNSSTPPQTVRTTTHNFTGLTPGSNYTFTVTTQTADGTSAAPGSNSFYTEPEMVQPTISSQGSNSSIQVSWNKPSGNVEYYAVFLELQSLPQQQSQNITMGTTVKFDGLSAGRIYSARVVTHSGPRSSPSTYVSNATFPNPPGQIEVPLVTNSSIDIKWTAPHLMSDVSFQYRLIISSPGADVINVTDIMIESHTFNSLPSGTPFIVSVQTVGIMMFVSEKAQIQKVTTRPFNVGNLTAAPQEESITVAWSKPIEYKETYRFHLTWQSSQGLISHAMTNSTKYNITGLVPGTDYNFNVTTETLDGTQAEPRQISQCSDASPVVNFTCEGRNTTDAQLLLDWVAPKGQHLGFSFIAKGGEINNSTKTCCRHTLSNLRHHTVYQLSVATLGCGRSSKPSNHECRTGITDPPVPQDNGFFMSNTTQKSFSVWINASQLDDTKGPITHIGVLVASELPDYNSNWTTFLEKNYTQFKQKNTTAYLATVVERSHSRSRSVGSHLILDVGNGSTWEAYNNGPLDAGAEYYYAVLLFTNLPLLNHKVRTDELLVSKTNFVSIKLEEIGGGLTGIIVGATLGLLCAVVIVGFAVFCWRRAPRKEPADVHIHSMRAKVSVEVRTEDYEQYYKKQRADSNCGFAEEFEDLKVVGTSQSKNSALQLENKPKNRYNNVLPYDSSRVKLSIIHGSPYDDYINANYMPGYNSSKEFIAAQGPLPATVKCFWRMIWEKNVQTLVMLTRCNEQGRVKCEKYWDVGTKHFDNINVTMTSEIPLEDWTIRDFDIKNVKTAETRSVRQFHFTAWPDHGVPETTELLIGFRHLVREHMDQYSKHSPTVVHCSAGVGRTGTFIAIDRLIFQIERDNIVDVYGIVHDLRMHRPLMVQTEDQYVFLNQCAMDIIRSRTGTNVDLIYQNTAALCIYENVEPKKG